MTAAHAQDADVARLSQQLVALDADAELGGLAAYERLQARQALEQLKALGRPARLAPTQDKGAA